MRKIFCQFLHLYSTEPIQMLHDLRHDIAVMLLLL